MRATPAAANPYFAPAGSLAQFFVVSEGISTDDALEGASMFLAAAADLGNGVEDGGRWAISCFADVRADVNLVQIRRLESGALTGT